MVFVNFNPHLFINKYYFLNWKIIVGIYLFCIGYQAIIVFSSRCGWFSRVNRVGSDEFTGRLQDMILTIY